MFISQPRLIAAAAGCLIVFAASDAWAQQGGRQTGAMGQNQAAGQTGGIGRGGGDRIGGVTDSGPSGAVTGEISQSADRVLSDVGTANGAGRAGMAGGIGATRGMGGMRGFGGMGGAFGASPFGANNAAAAAPSIRTRLRADIQTPALAPQMSDARAQRQINYAPIQRRVNGFSVSVLNGVATIAGTAPSERDRRMAELVLRLEPGVRQINNQIVISP